MGCGCNKGRSKATTYHTIRHQDGTTRNFLTKLEAEAAVRASTRTANPATLVTPAAATA